MHANDDDDVRRHYRSMGLALGNRSVLVHKLVLALDSIQELVPVLDSRLVLVLGSILAQELVHSRLVPVRSNHCHDDDGADQLLRLEQKT